MNKKEKEKLKNLLCPVVARTIRAGGSDEKAKEFIKTYGEDFLAVADNLVHVAAECDHVVILKTLLDAGIHPDCIQEEDDWLKITPLWEAIQHRAYNAVTCLLDAGADINNTENGREPSPLIWAASKGDIKMVKILLERGADLHHTYLLYGKEKFNALKWAVTEGHHEVADYLRSLGAVMPEETEMPPSCSTEELLADLSRYFNGKPLKFGLGEIIPASVPMMVHIFPPVKGKRKNTIFVTSGLIEYELVVPEGQEKYWYAEYFLEMPGAWHVKDKDLEQEKYFWPIRWLKAISRYPHEQATYYGDKAIVDTIMIPTLTTPDGQYDFALVERCEDLTLRVSDGRLVIYYRITPMCFGENGKSESPTRSE
jgi:hypothetical protein